MPCIFVFLSCAGLLLGSAGCLGVITATWQSNIWADIFIVPCGKLLQDVEKPWENPRNMIYFRGGFSRSMLRGKLW